MRTLALVFSGFAFAFITPACAVDPPATSETDAEATSSTTGAAGDEAAVDAQADGDVGVASAQLAVLAASSSAIVNTSGSRAAEAFFNRGSPAFIDLFDAKCDAHSVYVLYKINAEGEVRKANGGGCGTTLKIPLRSGAFNIQYRVCVDIQFATDPCSGLVFDHN